MEAPTHHGRGLRGSLTAVTLVVAAAALVGLATVSRGAQVSSGPASDDASCSAVAKLALKDVTITEASPVAAPYTVANNAPGTHTAAAKVDKPFCRIRGIAKPEGSSGINFEVWLPKRQDWNGNFRAEGTGGSAGSIAQGEMANGLRRGFATMSSDQGHSGNAWTFAKNPWSVTDFFGRAQHVTTVAAKQIVAAYYGAPASKSFYEGCSRGGDRGLQSAQFYPDDYDGIEADDPGVNHLAQIATEAWMRQWSGAIDPEMGLPRAKLELVHKAVLSECQKTYGNLSGDDFLNNPLACTFKPAKLLCKKGQDTNQCLTHAQVIAMEKIYAGTRDPVTGAQVHAGFVPGGEIEWLVAPDRQLSDTPQSFFGDYILNGQTLDYKSVNLHTALEAASKTTVGGGAKLTDVANLQNPSLERFRARGGKIIITSAWSDCCRPPLAPIGYYKAVTADQAKLHKLTARQSPTETSKFARLFMVPGISHCGGGLGPTQVGRIDSSGDAPIGDADHDTFTALEKWVSTGVAPDKVVATKYEDNDTKKAVKFTRLVCQFPQVAVWNGQGNSTEAKNFMCRPQKLPTSQ